MGLLSKFFQRTSDTPLPTVEELLSAKGVPLDLPELRPFLGDFEHLGADERERWARAVAELHAKGQSFPEPWVEAQYEVLPELVPTWKGEREGFFYKPALEGLSQRLRVGTRIVPGPWFALWDVSETAVLERALENLTEKSKGHSFERLPSGVYRSTWGDGLDAARLLLPDLWKDLFPGQNTFVAIPRADLLLVAPQVLLPKLVDAIGRSLAEEGADRIQAVILASVNGKLLPANLQDPHPIAQPQRELRQADLMEAYRVQDGDLDPALGLCAPLTMLRTSQGRTVTMVLWAEGKPALLPDSDTVGFVSKSGKPLGIYFRQTLPRIPELVGTPVDIWGPRRLRYEGFPNPDQLEVLEGFATAEQMASIFKGQANPGAPKASIAPPPPLASGSSPVPAHLRGQSLGVQSND